MRPDRGFDRSRGGGADAEAGTPFSGSADSWWTLPLRSPAVAAVVAALVAVVVYANSLGNGFALDDVPVVLENEAIHDLSNLPGVLADPYWGAETGRLSGIWRPATTAFLAVEWALWEETAAPYHGVNVLLHGGVTALVTLVAAQLMPVGAAFVAGLVFAVHPVHVEAVANIVGVAELLAALFGLGAFLILIGRKGSCTSHKTLGPGRSSAILALYAMAFLTKESAVVLPGLFVLYDAWNDQLRVRDLPGYLRRRGPLLALMAAVAGGILWVRMQVLGSIARTVPPLGADLLGEIPRIWTLPVIWLHYLRLLVFPEDLSPDYTPGVIEVQLGWNTLNVLGVVVVLALFGLAWASWRDGRVSSVLTLGILWFVVAILPVSNALFLSEILLAERTLYIPSVGFALIAGVVVWRLAHRSKGVTSALAGIALVLMIARTWTATPVWESSGTVMNHLLAEHPESGRVQWMWADVMMDQANDTEAGLAAYRRALGATGGTYAIADAATEHLLQMGAYRSAARIARLLWDARPDDPTAPSRLALALFNQGRYRALVDPARFALDWRPESPILHHMLAVGYRERGEWQRAIEHRRAVIRAGEGESWQLWRSLAGLRMEVADTSGALADLDSARARAVEAGVRQELDSLRSAWSTPDGGG